VAALRGVYRGDEGWILRPVDGAGAAVAVWGAR
jgi:hypothetical protein